MVLAPCAPGPCRNSGKCRESEDYESFSCICPTGWQGGAATPCGPGLGQFPGGTGTERAGGVRAHGRRKGSLAAEAPARVSRSRN